MTTKSPAAKHLNHLIKYTITIVLVAWTKTTTNGDEQKKKKKSITTKCCVRICGLAWDGDISNEEKERERNIWTSKHFVLIWFHRIYIYYQSASSFASKTNINGSMFCDEIAFVNWLHRLTVYNSTTIRINSYMKQTSNAKYKTKQVSAVKWMPLQLHIVYIELE